MRNENNNVGVRIYALINLPNMYSLHATFTQPMNGFPDNSMIFEGASSSFNSLHLFETQIEILATADQESF